MGCDTFVSCPVCKVTHDCGYGSYRSFERRAAAALEEHKDCEGVESWSSDYTFYDGDDLMLDGRIGGDLFIAGEKNFVRVSTTYGGDKNA